MISSDESRALFTCSFHKNNNHSDKDCRKQKELRGKKTAPPKFSNKPSDSFYSCSDQVYKINMWYVDSGASFHMTPDRTLFNAQEPSQGEIIISDGNTIQIKAIESITLQVLVNGIPKSLHLENVRFVPELKFNLFSEISVLNRGLYISKENDKMTILTKDKSHVIVTATQKTFSSLFTLDTVDEPAGSTSSQTSILTVTPMEAHRRLGHVHYQVIKDIRSGKVESDLSIAPGIITDVCRECILGKHRRSARIKTASRIAHFTGHQVNADLTGKMDLTTLQLSLIGTQVTSAC